MMISCLKPFQIHENKKTTATLQTAVVAISFVFFSSLLQISAFFLFSNIRKGRLLYIHPVGWLVGQSVGRLVGRRHH